MSILIKGMEMPKDCRECPVVQRTKSGLRCPMLSKRDGFSHTASRGIIGRMGGCPLVEVPASHGDLIDRGALNIGEYEREDDDSGTLEISIGGLFSLYHKVIDASPVIEAEVME